MACGPVENESGPESAPAAPHLAVQVQEGHGGDLGSQLGKPLVSTTTVGTTNQVTTNCGGTNTAPDLSFTWTPPFSGTFKFTTEGSSIDTVLTVHPVNNSTTITGCNDDEDGGAVWSSLTLPLAPGTGYTIVVDGYGKSAGPIQLNITAPGNDCGGSCATPPSTCHQSTGTCNEGICTYPFKAFGASCNDGKSCTTGEICDGAGTCGAGSVACNTPTSQCHQGPGACAADGTCSYGLKPAGTSCDDGSACTSGDVCSSTGTCSGTSMVCNSPPNTQCYQANGTCSGSGCSYLPMPQGTPCNDGNACTPTDTCNGTGTCGGPPKVCNTPPSQCYEAIGTCSTSTGECSYALKAAGTVCDDGNSCTTGDTCKDDGTCGGSAMQCDQPANQCMKAACVNGACATSPKPSGSSCSDGLSCTGGDTCDGNGTCRTSPTACRPTGPCNEWTGACTPTGACDFQGCPEGMYCTRYGCEGPLQ